MIVVEDEPPCAVARSTRLPAPTDNLMAFVPAKVPAASGKPEGQAGWGEFRRSSAQSATAFGSPSCRFKGEGNYLDSGNTWFTK